jgi:hypothetical protein
MGQQEERTWHMPALDVDKWVDPKSSHAAYLCLLLLLTWLLRLWHTLLLLGHLSA